MKEKIYTIPVTEAFSEDCECPVCLLEKKLEEEYVDYFLGPSLMEPDCRIETNDKGFCRRHGELLYSRQENRLGLALTIETHLREQLNRLNKISDMGTGLKSLAARLTFKSKSNNAADPTDKAIDFLKKLRQKCALCSKLEYTMDRYMDVTLYLWSTECEFKMLFESRKGFCLKHMEALLTASGKYLDTRSQPVFAEKLIGIQLDNLERIRQEVDWFAKKFDYRNSDAPWGNSKDAVSRSLQKLYGYSSLK